MMIAPSIALPDTSTGRPSIPPSPRCNSLRAAWRVGVSTPVTINLAEGPVVTAAGSEIALRVAFNKSIDQGKPVRIQPLAETVTYHAPCQQQGHGIGKPARP